MPITSELEKSRQVLLELEAANLFIPLLLFQHHPDNPVLDVFIQDDILILGIQRVEDPGAVELLVLLKRRFFFVVLRQDLRTLRFEGVRHQRIFFPGIFSYVLIR